MRSPFRAVLLLVPLALGAAPAPAERAEDLLGIHIEAIGGRERIDGLAGIRASGLVIAGGKRLRFAMTAERPNRVRLETESGGRTLVQGWDGEAPPWEFDTGTWPPRYHDMAEANVKTFTADAEFDDPIVAGKKRGFTFEDAGEAEVDGRKLLRLLVKRKGTGGYFLLLDPQTYLIILRVEQRQAGGRGMQVITRFGDYRPVGGVLYPHDIAVIIDGKVTQQTKVERVEANPKVTKDSFIRPKPAVEAKE